MGGTTFVDKATTIPADWLNVLNALAYNVVGDGTVPGTTRTLVLANLGFTNSTDAEKGDALVAIKRAATGAIATTLHTYLERGVYDVRDFGAVGDGVADDTAAIQAACTAIAASQFGQIAGQRLTRACIYFPDGNYRITNSIQVRGFVGLLGTGTAYTGGAVIHQATAAKNIFEFYGSTADQQSLGIVVEGLNFEFDSTLGSSTGVALYFPKLDDVSGLVLNSNSHYIRRNRFGGWHRKGHFLLMAKCNDVEISGNVIDVDESGAAITLGSATDSASVCSDIRISGNNFFFCYKGVALRNVTGVSITGNSFSTQFAADWTAIDLTAGGAAIVVGRVSSVAVQGNEFLGCYTPYRMDGSATNVAINGNTHYDAGDYLLAVEGATDVRHLSWRGDVAKVKSAFSRIAVIASASCKIKDSTVSDLQVDANGVNGLNSLMLEQSSQSGFSTGMTIRNNRIVNNTSPAGGNAQLVPCTAAEYTLENLLVDSSYPTNRAVLHFNTVAVGDSVSFLLDYEVAVDKSGVNTAYRTGRKSIKLLRAQGTLVSQIDEVGTSLADDIAGSGGGVLPVVTFAVSTAAPSKVELTVTSSLTAPITVTTRLKAHSFRASGSVQIKIA